MFTLERIDPEMVLLAPQSRRGYGVLLGLGLGLYAAATVFHFPSSLNPTDINRFTAEQVILTFIFIILLLLSLRIGVIFTPKNEKVLSFEWTFNWKRALLAELVNLFVFGWLYLYVYPAPGGTVFPFWLLYAFWAAIFLSTLANYVSKMTIHEDGIYYRRKFYPWNEIQKVAWKGDNDDCLAVLLKDQSGVWRNPIGMVWRIPLEKKPAIDRILERNHLLAKEESNNNS